MTGEKMIFTCTPGKDRGSRKNNASSNKNKKFATVINLNALEKEERDDRDTTSSPVSNGEFTAVQFITDRTCNLFLSDPSINLFLFCLSQIYPFFVPKDPLKSRRIRRRRNISPATVIALMIPSDQALTLMCHRLQQQQLQQQQEQSSHLNEIRRAF
jgi:hypothetical protein